MSDVRATWHPRLGSHVEIRPSTDGSAPSLVGNRTTGRWFRMQPATAALLASLDGRSDVNDVATRFQIDAEKTGALVRRFQQLRLLDDVEDATPELRDETRRSLMALRITLVRPGEVLTNNREQLRRVMTRPVVAVAAAIGLFGLLVGMGTMDRAQGLVRHGLDGGAIPMIVVAVIGSLVLHEVAHAVALTWFGGRVRSMGFMLLYLRPTLFCDISDVWALRDRWHRVHVALAGIYFNLFASGLASLFLAFGTRHRPSDLSTALAFAALFNLGVAAVNLVPFVRFDGYFAVTAYLERPNLRSRALAELGALTRLRARTDGSAPTPPQLGLALFGLACVVTTAFAVLLVVYEMAALV